MKYDIVTTCVVYPVDPLHLRPSLNVRHRVSTQLKWAEEDAAAIVMDFTHANGVQSSWRLDRSYLHRTAVEGESTGIMDYKMAVIFDHHTVTSWVFIELTGESHDESGRMEQIMIAIDRRTVQQFLSRTLRVPLGAENYGPAVDRFLASLQ